MARSSFGAAMALLAVACAGTAPKRSAPVADKPIAVIPSVAPAETVPRPRVEPGTRELVKELDSQDRISDPNERWQVRKKTFSKIRELADPRGADALFAYLERAANWPGVGERVHFRTEAALALAEIGDLRALPALAERLGLDPLEVYSEQNDSELLMRRDDSERIVCARLIADLADLHPEQRAAIRAQAEQAVWAWVTSMPEPHANGLRALARMNSEDPKIRDQIGKWADPAIPLPAPGAEPPFPVEFVTAQVSLRYLGALGDAKAYGILEKQLRRRPKQIDVTMDGLMQGGIAMLGMSLRGLEIGAAEGLSELGDPKAVPALMKLVADDRENEQARDVACQAAAWLASAKDALSIAKRIEATRAGADKATRFRASCWLSALAERPLVPAKPMLLRFVESGPVELRDQAARALGNAGLDPNEEAKLVGWLADSTLRDNAALALLLGGTAASAKRVIESSSKEQDQIRELYFRSFGFFSHEDLERGRLFRWVGNARSAGDSWASRLLKRQFDNAIFDNGPHSLTLVVLRGRAKPREV